MPRLFRVLRRRMSGGGFLAAALALSLMLGALAACGGSTGGSTSPTPTPVTQCLSTPPAIPQAGDTGNNVRYWVPGTFLVGLISYDGGLGARNALSQVATHIDTIVNNVTKNMSGSIYAVPLCGAADAPASNTSAGDAPSLMVFAKSGPSPADVGIAAFQLVEGTTSSAQLSTNDYALTSVVSAINRSVTSTAVSTSSGSVFVAGAIPDLLGTGSSLWHTSGSPDGTPSQGASSWNADNGTGGSGKTVAILDTAPPPVGPLCLSDSDPKGDPTPVVPTPSDLSSANCPFLGLSEQDITIAENIVASDYPAYANSPNDTSFEQHGQFVAEIIHHLAPQASLELVRVLGNHGGGDLRSLIAGLHYVYNQGNLSNTIVNMSLELQPPTECLPSLVNHVLAFKGESVTFTSPMNWSSCGGYTPPETVTSIASNATDARLFVPMGLVMEQMAAAGVTLVAAAGNDSTSYTLGADMPGAYCNAISVGALSGTPASGMGTVSYNSGGSTRAPYANLPTLEANGCLSVSLNNASGIPDVVSTPLTDGTATAYAYATGEVCSLFMDQSNSNYVNTSIDSSLWSGSSFSAPVISAEEALGILTQTSYQQPCS